MGGYTTGQQAEEFVRWHARVLGVDIMNIAICSHDATLINTLRRLKREYTAVQLSLVTFCPYGLVQLIDIQIK